MIRWHKKKSYILEDLKDLPLILPRRQDVQNEITNWFGAYYQKLNIRFTCNMPTNGAKMVRKGLGYLITVQGVSELWKEEEIVGRFLDPPIICRSVFTEKGTAIQPCCDEVYRSYPGKFVKTARK